MKRGRTDSTKLGGGMSEAQNPGHHRYRHPLIFQHNPEFTRLAHFLPPIAEFCALKSLTLEKSSVRNIKMSLFTFLHYMQDVRKLDLAPTNVTRQIALEHQLWNSNRGLVAGSVARHSINLRAFFSWFESEKIARSSGISTIRIPTRTRGLPRPMSPAEINAIFRVLDPTNILELRDLAIFELAYGSGMRVGDALKILIDDVVFSDEILGPHVRARCKGMVESIIPLTRAAVPVLKLYFAKRKPCGKDRRFFVNRHRNPRFISRSGIIGVRWKYYLRRAGLPSHYTMHMLRHSAATHLYANGMPIEKIQRILGHARLHETQVYARITPIQAFRSHASANIRGMVDEQLQLMN